MPNPYTTLARQAITDYLQSKKVISPPADLPAEITQRRGGVFVTLSHSQNKKLRGCIGTYLPTQPSLAEEIIANAIAAATTDYRFDPILPNELPALEITVSLLKEPQQIKSLQELDVKKYGVIVKTAAGKSGLLLPDIDSVTTPEEQVAIAAQKGGIDLDTAEIYLYRFAVSKQAE